MSPLLSDSQWRAGMQTRSVRKMEEEIGEGSMLPVRYEKDEKKAASERGKLK